MEIAAMSMSEVLGFHKSRNSRFEVGGEEVPQDVTGLHPSGGIEVRVERDLTGNVHGNGIPGVYSSDQFVKLYFGIPTAIRGILLNQGADVSPAIA
jgi:hypothetical protein